MKQHHFAPFLALAVFLVASCGESALSSTGNSSVSSFSSTADSIGTSSTEASNVPVSESSSSSSSSSSSNSSSSPSSTSSSSEATSSSLPAITGAVTLLRSGGLFESAFVEWSALEGATGYNVYYSSVESENWVKLDTELIREYPTYFRADAVGLPAGNYRLKITPIHEGVLQEKDASITSALTVKAYRREGFAFKNGSSSGAYNADGSLKSNAVVIYISEANKNTVTHDMIAGKTATTFTGFTGILYALQKGKETHCFDFRLLGEIKNGFTAQGSSKSACVYVDNVLKSATGITIEGIGNDATCNGWQFLIKDSSNIELRNLGFMNCASDGKDGLSVEQGNDYVWIHHNDVFYGMAGKDADQVKGDGGIDVKNSNHTNVSYNHFFDSGKACLLENGEVTGIFTTYDHNWFDHSDSRHPRIRFDTVHIYNNYYDGNAKYGVGATSGSSVFVENNYFRNCKYPMLISMQGSDIAGGEGTFSSEDGGMIKAYNNHIEGGTTKPYSTTNTTEFDYYEVSSRSEEVPASVGVKQGGTSYNNFDTGSLADTANVDATEDVPALVSSSAGRMEQGDFKWTFTSADDTSFALNTALKNALLAYKTSLVSIGGNSL